MSFVMTRKTKYILAQNTLAFYLNYQKEPFGMCSIHVLLNYVKI